MGKPRADLTKAAALAAELEDDELVGLHLTADDLPTAAAPTPTYGMAVAGSTTTPRRTAAATRSPSRVMSGKPRRSASSR